MLESSKRNNPRPTRWLESVRPCLRAFAFVNGRFPICGLAHTQPFAGALCSGVPPETIQATLSGSGVLQLALPRLSREGLARSVPGPHPTQRSDHVSLELRVPPVSDASGPAPRHPPTARVLRVKQSWQHDTCEEVLRRRLQTRNASRGTSRGRNRVARSSSLGLFRPLRREGCLRGRVRLPRRILER